MWNTCYGHLDEQIISWVYNVLLILFIGGLNVKIEKNFKQTIAIITEFREDF